MKRTLLAGLVLAALGSTAHAAQTFHPSGSNLTYGVNSVSQSVITSTNNPAAGAIALKDDDTRFRMGLITVGAGYEVGDVGDFVDTLDRLIDKVDNLTIGDDPVALAAEFNAILPDASENGYMTTAVAGHLPLMPLLIASDWFGGAISLDISAGAQVKAGVLDDTITVTDPDASLPTLTGDEALDSGETSLFVNGGVISELSVGYSTNLMQTESGGLFLGAKLKYLNAELGRDNVKLDGAVDVDTALQDFDQNTVTSSAVTADLGVIWATDHYQLGATLLNVTSPSFKYPGALTFTSAPNCASRISAAIARCTAALEDAEYKLDAQLRLEAALYSASRSWLITGAYDTAETETPAGDKQQWAVIALGFAPESWIIPGLRVGYRQNMAGSELSYATFGLTLFKGLNLDLAYGLDSTKIDGEDMPRAVAANVAFEVRF